MLFMVINIMLMLTVGSLLLVLHLRLNTLRKTFVALPQSAETIRQVLEIAQQQMGTLKTDLKKIEPLVIEGSRTAQDLDFMLHRANQILEKLDAHQQPNLMASTQDTQQNNAQNSPIKFPKGTEAKVAKVTAQTPKTPETPAPMLPKTAAEKLKARMQEEG